MSTPTVTGDSPEAVAYWLFQNSQHLPPEQRESYLSDFKRCLEAVVEARGAADSERSELMNSILDQMRAAGN